jgi:hypothetical protein
MFCRTTKRRKEMEIPAFIYNVLPSQKREELITKRNVRIIKEYLKKREQMKVAKENDMARLKQLRKEKSISAAEYRRMKNVLIYGHEQKRIDLIRTSVEKSIKINGSSAGSGEQVSKNN